MRKVDNLGRIVIPKELRTKYGLFLGVDLVFEDSGDGILVKAAEGGCRICGGKSEQASQLPLCALCIEKIKKL